MTMNQWSQIFNKLNLALEKLSKIDSQASSQQSGDRDPDILENPQYVNQQGQSLNRPLPQDQNLTNLVVNVVEYDEDHDIDYQDYFQAIIDTDSISLDEIKSKPIPPMPTPPPAEEPTKDYIDLYDDLVDQLFDVNAPAHESSGLPGVGNKNPSPLSDFPSDEIIDQPLPDIGKYPVHLPIPLREAEKIGIRFRPHKETGKQPVNIGSSSRPDQGLELNDRVGGKTKLTAPSIIRLIFGPPTNMSEVRVSIPDFTSSGPVNIPSSLQLYGDIGKYINETMEDTVPDTQPQANVPFHKDFLEPERTSLQVPAAPVDTSYPHYDTPSYNTFNGYPVTHDYSAKQTYELPKMNYPEEEGSVNTAFLAALVDLLEEKERKKMKRPSVQIPMTDRPQSIKLPTQSALPKPQSLLALEARGRPAQPVPIEWLKGRPLPTQRLPPYHEQILQRSSASVPDQSKMDSILRRFSQSPFDSKVHRFKSPPVMLPINSNRATGSSIAQNPFTILNPQSLRTRQRQRRQTFVLETPDSLKEFVSDVQLHPSQAVESVLQNRPPSEVETTTVVSTSVSPLQTTTRKPSILSKPSAIADTELVAAQTQLFNVNSGGGTGVQTSLLGFPNPFISTSSSGSISYNKLMIAAALSIVPTMAIAMPFLAPSVGKKRRRRRK